MHRALRMTLVAAAIAAAIVAVPLTARAVISGDGTDDIADVRNLAPESESPLRDKYLAAWADSNGDGTPDDGTDTDDVYHFHLKGGTWFYASMTGGDNDFDLLLYSANATSVAGTVPGVAYSETKGTSSERFFYQVPKTGSYYLNAFAFDGKGSYTIKWGLPSADRPKLTAGTTAAKVPWGGASTVMGTLYNAGGVLPNREVQLWGRTSGSGKAYTRLAKAKTDATGTYRFTVKPTSVMTYDLRYLGSEAYLPTENVADVKVSPYAYLTAPSVPKKVKKNKTFTSTGSLRPKHANGATTVKVKCYRKNSKGTYVWVKTVSAKNISYSSKTKTTKYSARVKLPKAGKWRFRAYVAGDSGHAATYSTYRYKTVK